MTARQPMTPPGCDLRDFPRMMIDIPRLFASTFNAQASRAPLAWMIGHKLWYRSWHQVPAASLPNDDDELCHLAELGFDLKSFRKAKLIAMRGWVQCEDGRLYHPVVAEAALEAWQEKLRQRMASAAGNRKRWGVDFDPTPLAADLRSLIACMTLLNPQSKTILKAQKSLSQCDAPVIPVGSDRNPSGTAEASRRDVESPGISSLGTGTGTETSIAEANASDSRPPAPVRPTDRSAPGAKPRRSSSPTQAELASFEAWWQLYPRKVGRDAARKAFVARLRQGLDLDSLVSATIAFAASRDGEDPQFTCHPTTYLNQGRWEDEPPTPAKQAPRRGPQQGWSALDQSLAHLRADKEDYH